MNQYNTSRSPLILREYGRNIQKLIEYIRTIEDMETRNRFAGTLIELMKQVTPTLRDTPETTQKMWDDLYIMSDFNLEIDSPYPMPERDILVKKPNRVAYNNHKIRFKHYGRNIELLVKDAIAMEDEKEQEDAIIYIGKLMKSFYNTWNNDMLDDALILDNIKTLSAGKLNIDIDKVRSGNLFESLYKERKRTPSKNTGGGRNNRNNNRGGKRKRN